MWTNERVSAPHQLTLRYMRVVGRRFEGLCCVSDERQHARRRIKIARVNDLLTESAQRSTPMVSAEANLALSDTSSPRVAFLASQGLADPASLSLDEVRAVCATALARVPDHRQVEIAEGRPYYEQIDMALALARYADQPDASEPSRAELAI